MFVAAGDTRFAALLAEIDLDGADRLQSLPGKQERRMTSILNIATTVSLGLLIGTELAVSVFINPVLWKLEGPAQARAIRLFAKRLGTAMPFWYALNLLLLIFEVIVRRGERAVLLIGTASGIWAAVILLTILFLVPINNRMARLDSDSLPEEARREHRRWDRLHRLRVVALGVAMVLFLIASQA
jgi:uncharacterized membrane protein